MQDMELHSQFVRGILHIARLRSLAVGIVWVDRAQRRRWRQASARAIAQAASAQPRCSSVDTPVTLAAGSAQTCNDPGPNGIACHDEYDRNRRGGRLSRQHGGDATGGQRSPPPCGALDRPRVPAIGHIGLPPSGVQSRRSGLRHNRVRRGLAEMRATGRRTRLRKHCQALQSPAYPTAARAPQAASAAAPPRSVMTSRRAAASPHLKHELAAEMPALAQAVRLPSLG